jgi:putative hydroxymethylpyrimidine transport system substrate-binding protein
MIGKIDMAAGMMRNVEPVVLQQHDFLPKMFYPEDFGIASYSELIYVAHAGETTPEIPAFLNALQEATQYLIQHPEEAWKKVISTYPQLNTPTNYAIWTKTVPLFSLDPHIIQKARS